MINITFTPFGVFGSSNEEISNFEHIQYYTTYKNNEGIDIITTIKEGDYTILDKLKEQWNLENNEDFIIEFDKEEPSNLGKFIRKNYYELGKKYNIFSSYEDYLEKMNYWGTELTNKSMKQSSEARDKLIIQTVSTLDDLDESLNLFSERFREWYSLYFPEMDKLIKKHELYISAAYEYTNRENYTRTRLKKTMPSSLARSLANASKESIGADLSDRDIETLKMFAGQIKSMYEFREELINYLNELMEEIAPNLSKVGGASLGARLISLTGGIDRLSKLPASAIQVIGAEKALFAHLRERALPPKHGVIFQHSLLQGSPWWVAGKVARAIANKLAIAVRADVYGNYIGDELLEQLQKKVEHIKKSNPEPKKKRRIPIDRDNRRKGGRDNRNNKGSGGRNRDGDNRKGGRDRSSGGDRPKGRRDNKGRTNRRDKDNRPTNEGDNRKRQRPIKKQNEQNNKRQGKPTKHTTTASKPNKTKVKVKPQRKIIGKTSSKL